MIPITETDDLYPETVPLLEVTDPVLGGPSGPSNAAAIALANRTRYLKAALDSLGPGGTTGAENVGTGVGLYIGTEGGALQLLTLLEGSNITLTPLPTGLRIDAVAGTGGGSSGAYFANIADFGAVPDFVPGPGSTGTGTDNAAAINAALATGKPLYIPAGEYWVGDWPTRFAYSRASVFGPGRVWGDSLLGKIPLGRSLFVGSTRSHEISYGGGIYWADNGGQSGIRQWTGHHNWMVVQADRGPTQFQIYPSIQSGAASCQAPNKLVPDYGTFPYDDMEVGDHIGWYGKLYKLASKVGDGTVTVTNFDGSAPGFVTDPTPRAWYRAYETSVGTCNVNGTTVTYVSGEQYPFGQPMEQKYAIINGVRYDVAQGPEEAGPNNLILTTSAGTQTNVPIEFRRCWGPWAYVTLFRLQGLGGGKETNCGMALNIRNECHIWNGGTDDALEGDMRINARKIYMGMGDGTGGTESFEVGDGYVILGRIKDSTLGNYVQVVSLGTSYAPIVQAEGPGANMDIVVSGKGSGGVQMGIGTNTIKAFAGSADFAPSLAARNGIGSTNPNFGFDMQGYGIFGFTCGAYARTAMRLYANNATAYLALGNHNTAPFIGVEGAADNLDLQMSAKGTGLIIHKSMPVLDVSGSSWQPVTLGNGFTLFGPGTPAGYRMEPNRVVRLKGALGTTGTNASTAFVLPVGFRPTQTSLFPGYGTSFVQINTDGSVRPSWSADPGVITLDGITFPTV